MLFTNSVIKHSDKSTQVGVFSQSNSADMVSGVVKSLAMQATTALLWQRMDPRANIRGKNARSRMLVNFTTALGAMTHFDKRKYMQSAHVSNRGWLFERVLSANWAAPASAVASINAAKAFGYSNRTPHIIRSFIGNGLNKVYRFNPPNKRTVVVFNKPRISPYSTTVYKMFRLRFERWFFKHLGNRTYVWFANIWHSLSSQFNKTNLSKMYEQAMRYLAKKGGQFYVEAPQAHVVFQSLFMAITSVTGLQFFMKTMSNLISSFRSHWALIRHLMTLFFKCKNYFWFKTLYQYRLVMRGKFGGHMRARQEVLQHGIVKIHQWDLNINYYRIFPVTKYGVFSVRLWLQMRDMRILRLRKVNEEIQRQSRSEARLRYFGYTRKNYKKR